MTALITERTMIAYLIGQVADLAEGQIVLENNGIGYRLFVPGSVTDRLSRGDEVKIHTHLAVREDAMALYGFLTKDDLDLFRLLLGVSGIGPKGALAVLGTMNADELRFAILADDSRTISKVPGIGRKTAQKLILELKDKMNLAEALEKSAEGEPASVSAEGGSAQSEAIMALTALGYPGTQAMKAVRKVTEGRTDLTVEEILKLALKAM